MYTINMNGSDKKKAEKVIIIYYGLWNLSVINTFYFNLRTE